MVSKRKKRLQKQGWFTQLLEKALAPQPPRLTKRQRRLLAQLEREEKQRDAFLNYLDWLLQQGD